jgi:hypothetical protein
LRMFDASLLALNTFEETFSPVVKYETTPFE